MSFSRDAWAGIGGLYAAILEMPFNRELAAGVLSRERFTYYMIQDAHYLNAFGRALAAAASRAPDNDQMIALAGSAREAVVVERALHEGFFRDYGLREEDVNATPPSPTCSHYAHYLLHQATSAPYKVALAALLPCFWIYWEVGKHLLETTAPDNPYQAWIDTYADEAFATGVRTVIHMTDALAERATDARRAEMHEAFVKASALEWMFWDAAWRRERWPVDASGPLRRQPGNRLDYHGSSLACTAASARRPDEEQAAEITGKLKYIASGQTASSCVHREPIPAAPGLCRQSIRCARAEAAAAPPDDPHFREEPDDHTPRQPRGLAA